MIAGSGLDDAPHMGDVGESYPMGGSPMDGSSYFLGPRGFCHFDSLVDFASSNQPIFG